MGQGTRVEMERKSFPILGSLSYFCRPKIGGWHLSLVPSILEFRRGAVAQSAVENQNDEGVLDFQGPVRGRDRAVDEAKK